MAAGPGEAPDTDVGPATTDGPTGPSLTTDTEDDAEHVEENDLNDFSDDLDFTDLRAEDLDYEFEDLSHEQERVYQFDNHVLTITEPIALNKQRNGSHKVLDSRGVSFDIYPKWNYIAWKSKDGQPHFTED